MSDILTSTMNAVYAFQSLNADRTETDAASKMTSAFTAKICSDAGIDPESFPKTKSDAAAKQAHILVNDLETLTMQIADMRSEMLDAIRTGNEDKRKQCMETLVYLESSKAEAAKLSRQASR